MKDDAALTRKPDSYTQAYFDFLASSPSPYHAAQQTGDILKAAGFTEVTQDEAWPSAPGGYFFTDQGTLLAWVLPSGPESCPPSFAIVGAHFDSPSLKLKPTASRRTADGFGELLVEVYGGPLLNSWLDRELLIAGQLVDKDGKRHLVTTPPIARIPQLAVHLDRTVNARGLVLDPQQHMQPIWTVDEPDAEIMELVANCADLDADDIVATDLFLYPSQGPAIFGSRGQFIAAGRQDNLSSAFAAANALAAVSTESLSCPARIPVLAIFDHEEVGSRTATGAAGALLPRALERIARLVGRSDEEFERMLARSSVVSSDASHSVHPAYPKLHDPDTRPVLGRGPVLKLDADQNYATNAVSAALWEEACDKAGVETQYFVSESSLRSGSTIGPALAAGLGVPVVDVGIPLLSMHSTREMSHVDDTPLLGQVMEEYWRSHIQPAGLPAT